MRVCSAPLTQHQLSSDDDPIDSGPVLGTLGRTGFLRNAPAPRSFTLLNQTKGLRIRADHRLGTDRPFLMHTPVI